MASKPPRGAQDDTEHSAVAPEMGKQPANKPLQSSLRSHGPQTLLPHHQVPTFSALLPSPRGKVTSEHPQIPLIRLTLQSPLILPPKYKQEEIHKHNKTQHIVPSIPPLHPCEHGQNL